MATKSDKFIQSNKRVGMPDIKPGDNIRIVQSFIDNGKKKTQPFEGKVLAIKHNKEVGATITVRRDTGSVAVEKIFPLNSPTIVSLTILDRYVTRRAKLNYLRDAKGKRARLKKSPKQPEQTDIVEPKAEVKAEPKVEAPKEEIKEDSKAE